MRTGVLFYYFSLAYTQGYTTANNLTNAGVFEC
jgi:hypothetical protein